MTKLLLFPKQIYNTMGKSTIMTGVAIANSMIGTSMILFPVTFNQTGILVNVLFCILMAAVMALTCKLFIMHIQPHEAEVSISIKRKLGPAFGATFAILSALTVFLVSSIFFLLASDLLYDALEDIFGELAFSEKIFQLVLMVIFALLNYLPDLKYVFKATPIAMAALVLSTVITIISIAFNLDNIDSDFFKIKSLTAKQILSVAAINGFSFVSHPSISPMIKQNQKQRENAKAVYIAYAIATFLYVAVGVLGALSIYGRVPAIDKSSYNIIDYYSGEFQAPIIGFLTVAYLFMISPIFPFVAKNQISELIPQQKRKKIPKLFIKASVIYSILWVPCNIAFIVFETSPTVVIGFASTVTAYYVTYFLPVIMTLKVGDFVVKSLKNEDFEQSLISEEQNRVSVVEANKQPQAQQTDQNTTALLDQKDGKQIDPVLYEDPAAKASKWQRIFYGIVLAYGSVMLVFELISFFE